MIFIIAGFVFGIIVGVKEKIGGGLTVVLTVLLTFVGAFCSLIIGSIIGMNLPLERQYVKEVQLISLNSSSFYNCDTLEDNTVYVWRDGSNYNYMYVENNEIIADTVSGTKAAFYTDNQIATAKIYRYSYKEDWYCIIANPIVPVAGEVEFYLPENSILL